MINDDIPARCVTDVQLRQYIGVCTTMYLKQKQQLYIYQQASEHYTINLILYNTILWQGKTLVKRMYLSIFYSAKFQIL